MLTGTMPFKSDNDNKLLQAILREQPRLSGNTDINIIRSYV